MSKTYFIYRTADESVPPASLAVMASRAGRRKTTVVLGESHVVMTGHPREATAPIEAAAYG